MLRSVDVLVVDDRAVDADATMLALRRAAPDIRALRLENGDAALQYLFAVGAFRCRSHTMPHLVLLDVEMPGMSGLSVLDVIRAHPMTSHVRVVLLRCEDSPVPRRGGRFDAHACITRAMDLETYCIQIECVLERWLPRDRTFAYPVHSNRTAYLV